MQTSETIRQLRHGYHELVNYQTCPRLWSWTTEGWQIPVSSAMLAGTLVHLALAAYYRSHRWKDTVSVELAKAVKEGRITLEDAASVHKDATEHLDRYVEKYAKDYTAVAVEEKIVVDGVPATIDLVAGYREKLVLVDFKRVSYPNTLAYRVSGQLDLYAYMYERKYGRAPDLCIYDLISEKGIMRVEYSPDLAKGCYQFCILADLATADISFARANPAYGWHCYTCPMVSPCHLLDEDGPTTALDYFRSNFKREV